jgi:hypothetical protein
MRPPRHRDCFDPQWTPPRDRGQARLPALVRPQRRSGDLRWSPDGITKATTALRDGLQAHSTRAATPTSTRRSSGCCRDRAGASRTYRCRRDPETSSRSGERHAVDIRINLAVAARKGPQAVAERFPRRRHRYRGALWEDDQVRRAVRTAGRLATGLGPGPTSDLVSMVLERLELAAAPMRTAE